MLYTHLLLRPLVGLPLEGTSFLQIPGPIIPLWCGSQGVHFCVAACHPSVTELPRQDLGLVPRIPTAYLSTADTQ